MSANSTNREIFNLQQDAPVDLLPTLSNQEVLPTENFTELTSLSEKKELIKPFFLYKRDGLYGLL
ncbi:MAG: hypothetical protein ACO1N4_03675 [Pedobacter sp.]|jgi:hypothetical protein